MYRRQGRSPTRATAMVVPGKVTKRCMRSERDHFLVAQKWSPSEQVVGVVHVGGEFSSPFNGCAPRRSPSTSSMYLRRRCGAQRVPSDVTENGTRRPTQEGRDKHRCAVREPPERGRQLHRAHVGVSCCAVLRVHAACQHTLE